jgi:hypothetical protein
MGIGIDKVGDKVKQPSPRPSPPRGEPPPALVSILVSDQFHVGIGPYGGIEMSEAFLMPFFSLSRSLRRHARGFFYAHWKKAVGAIGGGSAIGRI